MLSSALYVSTENRTKIEIKKAKLKKFVNVNLNCKVQALGLLVSVS